MASQPRTGTRRNITQPPDWWEAFAEAAADRGMSLSEWIGEACRRRLPAEIRRSLTDRPGIGRPPNASSFPN